MFTIKLYRGGDDGEACSSYRSRTFVQSSSYTVTEMTDGSHIATDQGVFLIGISPALYGPRDALADNQYEYCYIENISGKTVDKIMSAPRIYGDGSCSVSVPISE